MRSRDTQKRGKGLFWICLYFFAAAVLLLSAGKLELVSAAPQNFETPKSNDIVPVEFKNGSFEEPIVGGPVTPTLNINPGNVYFHMNDVEGWYTIPVNRTYIGSVYWDSIQVFTNASANITNGAASGNQAVDMSAHYPSRLYQICDTEPGMRVYWELRHGAIMWTTPANPSQAYDTMNVYIYKTPTDHTSIPPADSLQAVCTDYYGRGWGHHTGFYDVPAGQDSTILAFEAVSTWTGQLTGGNVLDDIRVYTSSFLEVEQSIVTSGDISGTAYAILGEQITYQISVTNTGESDASNVILTDVLPDGVEFIENSVEIDGAAAGALAVYANDTLTVNLGGGAAPGNTNTAGGRIKGKNSFSSDCNQTYEVTFQVKVTGQGKQLGVLIENQAKVVYADRNYESDSSYDNVSEVVGFLLKNRTISGSNIVWVDNDEDGMIGLPAKERTLAGTVVRMKEKATGRQANDVNGEPLMTVTDAAGEYSFQKIAGGEYIIEVDTPAGYHVSTGFGDNKGMTVEDTAVINPVDFSAEFTNTMHEIVITNLNIGFTPNVSIMKTASVNGAPTETGSQSAPVAVSYGDEIVYQLTVENQAADAADTLLRSLELSDILPKGLDYIESNPPAEVSAMGETIQLRWKADKIVQGSTVYQIRTVVTERSAFTNEGQAMIGSTGSLNSNKTYHESESSQVSLELVKELTGPSGREEQFVFLIEQRVPGYTEVKESFYGIVSIPAGETSAVRCFENIPPGDYTVTEVSGNWRYEGSGQYSGVQRQVIKAEDVQGDFRFENHQRDISAIENNAYVINQMKE